MRKLIISAVILAAVCVSGCRSTVEVEPAAVPAAGGEVRYALMSADASMKETVLVADPEGAVEEIYAGLSGEPVLTELDPGSLEGVMGVSAFQVMSSVAFTSDPCGGLCDIAIIEPAEGQVEAVREALIEYGVQRAESFKDYDILGAYDIASNSTVYSQGDFVIMLMLPDNEAAVEIIDRYLPQ